MNSPDQTKLRIAIVCDPLTDAIAGVIISTIRFAQLLREQGHTIIFIAAKSPAYPEHGEFRGMKVYRYRSLLLPRSGGEWYVSFPTSKELREVFTNEQIDLVHVMLPMPSGWIGLNAANKLGIPSVVHSHAQPENVLLHFPKFLLPHLLGKALYRLIFSFYRKASAIVYPTRFAHSFFRAAKYEKPETVISNGVDAERFRPADASEYRAQLGVPASAPHLIFVGRLQPEKSLETLLQALPRIQSTYPEAHLSIIGGGPLEASLKRLADRLEIADSVHFLGKVSDEEVELFYNSGDLFVTPSLAELEGMVVLEAMACGKPILVADSAMSASVHFVEGNGALFIAQDPDDLAAKAIELLSDVDALTRMGEQSRSIALRYDIRESVRALEAFYAQVISTP